MKDNFGSWVQLRRRRDDRDADGILHPTNLRHGLRIQESSSPPLGPLSQTRHERSVRAAQKQVRGTEKTKHKVKHISREYTLT